MKKLDKMVIFSSLSSVLSDRSKFFLSNNSHKHDFTGINTCQAHWKQLKPSPFGLWFSTPTLLGTLEINVNARKTMSEPYIVNRALQI